MTQDEIAGLKPGDTVRLAGYQRRRAEVITVKATTVIIRIETQKGNLRVMPEEIDAVIGSKL